MMSLNRRLIQCVADKSSELCPDVMRESVDVFTCPKRFAREKQQFFLDTPQVAGFAGEVAEPNQYFTTDIMGIPVLVARDSDGKLGAFINACAHKGARVADAFGQRTTFVCQFHGWSYRSDGTLRGRPQEACFASDSERCGLTRLPVSVRSGLVVVGLSSHMPDETVEHFLYDLEPCFSGFEFDKMHSLETRRYEVKANWKLVASLSHESYHFAVLHRDSVAQVLHDHAVIDTFGRHSRWAFPMKDIERWSELDEADWPNHVNGIINHTVFPGTVIIKNPEDAQMIRVEPGDSPGHSIVHYRGVYRNPKQKAAALEAFDFGGEVFEKEDLKAAAQCQQGLSARGGEFIIGRNEAIVQFWHRLWQDALRQDR